MIKSVDSFRLRNRFYGYFFSFGLKRLFSTTVLTFKAFEAFRVFPFIKWSPISTDSQHHHHRPLRNKYKNLNYISNCQLNNQKL